MTITTVLLALILFAIAPGFVIEMIKAAFWISVVGFIALMAFI